MGGVGSYLRRPLSEGLPDSQPIERTSELQRMSHELDRDRVQLDEATQASVVRFAKARADEALQDRQALQALQARVVRFEKVQRELSELAKLSSISLVPLF